MPAALLASLATCLALLLPGSGRTITGEIDTRKGEVVSGVSISARTETGRVETASDRDGRFA
jgi:hypothetical protein